MLNYGMLPSASQKSFIYIGSCPSTNTTDYHTWTVPRDARFVSFTCIGAGAGGGAGFAANSGNAKGGGGGGGSGGVTSASFSARALPGVLYLYATAGGVGSAVGTGSAGTSSIVSAYPISNVPSVAFVRSGNGAALGGQIGTGASGGPSGNGQTIATLSNMSLGGSALSFNFIVGVSGGNGGAVTPAAGSVSTIGTAAFPLCGGAGGGSCSAADAESAGGDITGTASQNLTWINNTVLIPGGTVKNDGNSGHSNIEGGAWQRSEGSPLYTLGGSGAGGYATAAGKNGGSGAIGCGGGGGGAGTTGGSGGRGGPGAILIEWW